jgi:hypothetical protein
MMSLNRADDNALLQAYLHSTLLACRCCWS